MGRRHWRHRRHVGAPFPDLLCQRAFRKCTGMRMLRQQQRTSDDLTELPVAISTPIGETRTPAAV